MLLTIFAFTHVLLALAANGSWVNYSLPCLPSNVLNRTNGSVLNCIYATDTQNFPNFFLYIYLALMAIYFIIYAANRGRRAFIGVGFLSFLTSVIMAGAGMLPFSIVGIAWSVFVIITALVLIFGG